jgi:hypothetical protein
MLIIFTELLVSTADCALAILLKSV